MLEKKVTVYILYIFADQKTLTQFEVVAVSSVSSKLRLSYCEMANLTEDAAVTLRSLQT
jgi:hypothetical protein